jgi:hypothetical protein
VSAKLLLIEANYVMDLLFKLLLRGTFFLKIPTSSPASPATVDFCVNLDRDFQSIVAAKLGPASLAALLTQQDPATMTEGTGRRIQKEIMQIVFGEQKALKGLPHEIYLAFDDVWGRGHFFNFLGSPMI